MASAVGKPLTRKKGKIKTQAAAVANPLGNVGDCSSNVHYEIDALVDPVSNLCKPLPPSDAGKPVKERAFHSPQVYSNDGVRSGLCGTLPYDSDEEPYPIKPAQKEFVASTEISKKAKLVSDITKSIRPSVSDQDAESRSTDIKFLPSMYTNCLPLPSVINKCSQLHPPLNSKSAATSCPVQALPKVETCQPAVMKLSDSQTKVHGRSSYLTLDMSQEEQDVSRDARTPSPEYDDLEDLKLINPDPVPYDQSASPPIKSYDHDHEHEVPGSGDVGASISKTDQPAPERWGEQKLEMDHILFIRPSPPRSHDSCSHKGSGDLLQTKPEHNQWSLGAPYHPLRTTCEDSEGNENPDPMASNRCDLLLPCCITSVEGNLDLSPKPAYTDFKTEDALSVECNGDTTIFSSDSLDEAVAGSDRSSASSLNGTLRIDDHGKLDQSNSIGHQHTTCDVIGKEGNKDSDEYKEPQPLNSNHKSEEEVNQDPDITSPEVEVSIQAKAGTSSRPVRSAGRLFCLRLAGISPAKLFKSKSDHHKIADVDPTSPETNGNGDCSKGKESTNTGQAENETIETRNETIETSNKTTLLPESYTTQQGCDTDDTHTTQLSKTDLTPQQLQSEEIPGQVTENQRSESPEQSEEEPEPCPSTQFPQPLAQTLPLHIPSKLPPISSASNNSRPSSGTILSPSSKPPRPNSRPGSCKSSARSESKQHRSPRPVSSSSRDSSCSCPTSVENRLLKLRHHQECVFGAQTTEPGGTKRLIDTSAGSQKRGLHQGEGEQLTALPIQPDSNSFGEAGDGQCKEESVTSTENTRLVDSRETGEPGATVSLGPTPTTSGKVSPGKDSAGSSRRVACCTPTPLDPEKIGSIRQQLYEEGLKPSEKDGGVSFFIPVTEDGLQPQANTGDISDRLTKSKKACLNYEERLILANINRQAQLSKKKEFAVRDIKNVNGVILGSDTSNDSSDAKKTSETNVTKQTYRKDDSDSDLDFCF